MTGVFRFDHDMKHVQHMIDAVTCLSEDDRTKWLRLHTLFERYQASPPTLMTLKVGEHPSLPVFARHFKSFTSKVSGGCQDAEPALSAVYGILKQAFPTNVRWYWDEWDYDEVTLLQEPLAESPVISRDVFYANRRLVQHSRPQARGLQTAFTFGICMACQRQGKEFKICARCKIVEYCSKKCQKANWTSHKTICLPIDM